MRSLVLALLVVAGCKPCQNGQCELFDGPLRFQTVAQRVTWNDHYGEVGAPPEVTWIEKGDCATNVWGLQGVLDPEINQCVWGIYYPPTEGEHIYVVVLTDYPYLQWKTYAHELLHAHFKRAYGDEDHDHKREDWQTVPDEVSVAIHDAGVYQ